MAAISKSGRCGSGCFAAWKNKLHDIRVFPNPNGCLQEVLLSGCISFIFVYIQLFLFPTIAPLNENTYLCVTDNILSINAIGWQKQIKY